MRMWLYEYRINKGLSQRRISEIADIDRTHYVKIEKNQRRPSPEVAQKIAQVLDFDWKLFYPETQNRKDVSHERTASIQPQRIRKVRGNHH